MYKFLSHALLSALGIFMLSACSDGPKPLYDYGDYSQKYYNLKKDQNENSLLAFEKAMQESIEKSPQSRSMRVAPGMYANLGYLYLKSGRTKEALANFEQEKAIYPESTHFMNRMIKKIELAQEGDKK